MFNSLKYSHLGDRKFISTQIRFGDLRKIAEINIYDSIKNEGEQRAGISGHIKSLKKAFVDGTFTPANMTISLYEQQQKYLDFTEETISLDLKKMGKLAIVDGGQRFRALIELRDEAITAQNKNREKMWDDVVFPLTILLDGNPKEDFVRLQMGKNIDASHLIMVKTQTNLFDSEHKDLYGKAISLAKLLDNDNTNCFSDSIRFDTKQIKKSIPISSLLPSGKSELCFSLLGSVRLLREFESDVETFSKKFIRYYEVIEMGFPRLVMSKGLLCPPPDGSKGGATLLIGIMNLFSFYEKYLKKKVTKEVIQPHVSILEISGQGNFSNPMKRQIMGDFAKSIFKDTVTITEDLNMLPYRMYEGVPLPLVELLGPSTFNLPPFPKKPKEKDKEDDKDEDEDQ